MFWEICEIYILYLYGKSTGVVPFSALHGLIGKELNISFLVNLVDATLDEKLEECFHYCPVLLENVPTIFVSLGKDGVLVSQRDSNEITMKHYPAAPNNLLPVSVANASGAGDR